MTETPKVMSERFAQKKYFVRGCGNKNKRLLHERGTMSQKMEED